MKYILLAISISFSIITYCQSHKESSLSSNQIYNWQGGDLVQTELGMLKPTIHLLTGNYAGFSFEILNYYNGKWTAMTEKSKYPIHDFQPFFDDNKNLIAFGKRIPGRDVTHNKSFMGYLNRGKYDTMNRIIENTRVYQSNTSSREMYKKTYLYNDSLNNVIINSYKNNKLNKVTTIELDSLDRPIKETQKFGSYVSTQELQYDKDGNVKQSIIYELSTTTYLFDYKYNDLGDWIELIISHKSNNSQELKFDYKIVRYLTK